MFAQQPIRSQTMIAPVIDNCHVYGKVGEAIRCFEGGCGLEIVIITVRVAV
jgi:hypothetical protein